MVSPCGPGGTPRTAWKCGRSSIRACLTAPLGRPLLRGGGEVRVDLGKCRDSATPARSISRSGWAPRAPESDTPSQTGGDANRLSYEPWLPRRPDLRPACAGVSLQVRGVDGSNPSEGFAVQPATSAFLLSALTLL